jgi:hypothetical protein
MTTRQDIDKSLAEMERLASGSDEQFTQKPTAVSTRKSKWKRRLPSWMVVVGVAAVIDLAARFFIPSSMPFVLVFESVIFATASVSLIRPVVQKLELTGFRRKLHMWLAAAFALGAIRSGMWGFGVPVEYANLTIFLLGLAGVAATYLRRKRKTE